MVLAVFTYQKYITSADCGPSANCKLQKVSKLGRLILFNSQFWFDYFLFITNHLLHAENVQGTMLDSVDTEEIAAF